jgi:hypothetical protein
MNNPQQVNLTVKHSPWIQGYIDALNDTINLQAANQSEEYRDGYETAAAAEVKYIEQFMKGESDEF